MKIVKKEEGMYNRLSARKYIQNNKKAAGVLIMALALAFMALYLVNVLLMTTKESFKVIMFDLPKKISYLQVSGEEREKLIHDLNHTEGMDDVLYGQVLRTVYQSVIGSWTYDFPLMTAEEIPGFLDHMEAELIEGRLPEGDGEIVVDSVIAKNQNMKAGDWFMKSWWGETFKVVGIIRSGYMISAGTPRGFSNSGWYITLLHDEDHADVAEILKTLGYSLKEGDVVIDAVSGREDYKRTTEELDGVISVVIWVVAVFIIIAVLVAYVSFIRNRVNEYCLYASIGYGRDSIYGLIMREMAIQFGLAALLGILVSLFGAWLIRIFMVEPRGLVSKILYPDMFGKIIAVFVLTMGILQIPAVFFIRGIRTVDAIEE